jgi:hypothetical protein
MRRLYPGQFDVVVGGVGNQAQAIGTSILGGYERNLNTPQDSEAGPTTFGP